ncbi:MAG: eukaryotic-like serine/threonine-protein kinase [Acidobacteriota bacterium]|nr:eukaryotic-like serine/threonine-protein kinase [Acidobacteriota bacterium]
MNVSPGTRFDHYEILAPLGAGGMGEVYVARDARLGRRVALKFLPAEFTSDAGRLRRFKQEARAASSLNDPNIVTIHEIGEFDGQHYIATELVEGETLRRQLARGRLDLREALDVGVQIASALAAAHTAGIVHRDIKPENVVLRRDRLAKVLDFGLAKLLEPPALDAEAPTAVQVQTDPGRVLGTAAYMSPEQARGLRVDARTDIWSLGVVLYEMIAGRQPFAGAMTTDVLVAILKTEPPPLSALAPDAPRELERIVAKALRKDREQRYQTVKDLLIDLRDLKQELEFAERLERSAAPDARGVGVSTATEGGAQTFGATGSAPRTAADGAAQPTTSADYVVGGIRRHKLASLVALLVVVSAATGIGIYFLRARDPEAAIRSIAVLPFTNAGGNPDAEYLSDGISESLINSLSQLPGVKVIASSSSFRYKGKNADPQEVAKALGVEGVLTGKVLQRGDSLLINVELVKARDGTQVWGEQYNRKAADVLAVQSEISREIAATLRLKLTNAEREHLAERRTANPQAYELVLKGFYLRRKGGTENIKKAIEYYQQAIAIDPTYALAYSELCEGYRFLFNFGGLDPKEYVPKAEAAAQKALELDENLAEAHHALGSLERDLWDFAVCEREFKRAIELNPNLARAHTAYATYLSATGRHEQAIAEVKRARELDPLALLANTFTGRTFYFARRYDEALEGLKRALELEQNFALAHRYLGDTYAAKGMYAQAIAEQQEAVRLDDKISVFQIHLGAAYARAGERERAQTILKQLQAGGAYVSPGDLAILYAALGEREQAFASLERAYAEHDPQLQFLSVDPWYDSLRADPRFADLMRRIGF